MPARKPAKLDTSDKSTIIYLVRHGESEYNKRKILAGQVNTQLTEEGRKQAIAAKKVFGGIKINHVYSSDLDRAVHTAEIVPGRPVHPDNRLKSLREKTYGSLEGQPYHTVNSARTARINLPKQASLEYKQVDDMESDKDLADRFMPELKNIAERHPGETILIANHGSAIKVVIMMLQNKHYSEVANKHFRNGGYVKLIYKDGMFSVDEVHGFNEPPKH